MTNEEILRSYNEAKDPAKQVQILADLNACDTDAIKKILVSQGVDGRKLPRKKEKRKPASPAVLQMLDREMTALRARWDEVEKMIPRLKDEQASIDEKLNALKTARGVLGKVYEKGAR